VPLVQLLLTVGAVVLVYVIIRERLVAPLWTIKRDFLNNPLLHEPLRSRIWTGLAILALIIERSVIPLRLIPDYSFAEIIPIAPPFTQPVFVGVALLVALTASAWFLRRRDPCGHLEPSYCSSDGSPSATFRYRCQSSSQNACSMEQPRVWRYSSQ
jgi:hypothetical protein